MKKKIAVLLSVLILALSLVACGGSAEEEIIGTWELDMGYGIEATYTFDDAGTVTCTAYYNGEAMAVNAGAYTLSEEAVCIDWESGAEADFPYTYEGGELDIVSSADTSLHLVKID